MKKLQLKIISFICFSLAIFIYSLEKKDEKAIYTNNKQEITKNKLKKEYLQQKKSREIASIQKTATKVKRVTIGKGTDATITNRVSKDWLIKYEKSFKKLNVSENFLDIQITHKKSILKKENKTSRNLEHVLVRYKRASGEPYSFEALIDSQTGKLVQSWNRTRYEKKQAFGFKAVKPLKSL